MQWIDAFVRNPVKVAVGVLLVVLFGAISMVKMPKQLTPEVEHPTISIDTRWRGASPHEIEREIIQEQETQLKSVEGVVKLSSESMDSRGRITMEFKPGANMNEILLKVNTRLQQVQSYPIDADEPVISTSDTSDRPIARFVLTARPPERESVEAFRDRHPHLAEQLDWPLRAMTPGLMVYRLKALCDELGDAHPEICELLPPEVDINQIRRFVEDVVQARLERVPGVSMVEVYGGLEEELQVIVDPERLAARQLTITDLREALRSQNQDSSSGDFSEGKRRWVVRVLGQFRSPEQVERQLVTVRDGAPVYVGDIAEVRLGYKKADSVSRRYGTTSCSLSVQRESGANVLDVMDGLKQATAELNAGVLKHRELELYLYYDETEYINSAMGLVQQNIFIGGALTMIVLMLFLHRGLRTLLVTPLIAATAVAAAYVSPWFFAITLILIVGSGFWFSRGALVVGLAIPTSIVGTFLMLGLMGRSLNVISLAGMAFAVGMLVDNAVVVLENIHRRCQTGEPPFLAAVRGTQEVGGAVLASTLTTVAVFLPVLFVEDISGQLFRDIALAISCAVGLSLVVSFTLIPTASARLFGRRRKARPMPGTAVNGERRGGGQPAEHGLSLGNGHGNGHDSGNANGLGQDNGHGQDNGKDGSPTSSPHSLQPRPALPATRTPAGAEFVLRVLDGVGAVGVWLIVGLNRWIQRGAFRAVAVVALLVALSVTLSWAFWPKVEYLPAGNRNFVFGYVSPPPGYNIDELMEMGKKVEEDLKPYWNADPDSPEAAELEYPLIDHYFFVVRGRQVFIGLRAYDETRIRDLIPLLREVGTQFPGTIAVAKQSSLFERGITGGRTIDMEITGPDLERLVELGKHVLAEVERLMPDAQALPRPSLDLSSPEIHVEPRPMQARELGVSTVELGYTVDALVDGAYAGDFYVGGDKLDLTILSDTGLITRTQDLEAVPVATSTGQLVPLGAVAEIHLRSGPEQINRRERVRTITIQVTPPATMPMEEAMDLVTGQIVQPLRERGELDGEYLINLAGTADQLRNTWNSLRWNVALALAITYLLMAALFESWLYPLVIIFSVPLGAVGGILGLRLLNVFIFQPLDVLTMLGFVILIGTVVNNAILIVHQSLNHIRLDGMTPRDAIPESVRTRIRPIFITTMTTVLGLLPLVVFPGAGSELYRGLGSVVLGGLLVSTIFTLVLVPTVFVLLMDLKRMLGFGRPDEFEGEEDIYEPDVEPIPLPELAPQKG